MLQKYDTERDETRYRFDVDRDEVQRKFMAALWGVELEDDSAKSSKSSSTNGRKRKMTQQDIMRSYGK